MPRLSLSLSLCIICAASPSIGSDVVEAVRADRSEAPSFASVEERERSHLVECCATGRCFITTGDQPCPVPAPVIEPTATVAPAPDPEDELPLEAFRARGGATTMRGRLATALLHPFYSFVFIGRIEGEYAVELPHPDGAPDAAPTIMTWCEIRVLRPFRGALRDGELVTALFDGGALSPEHQVWRSEGPRCLPLDEGIFTLYEHRAFPGLLRPSEGGTVSFLQYSEPWEDNPLTKFLGRIAADAGVRQ